MWVKELKNKSKIEERSRLKGKNIRLATEYRILKYLDRINYESDIKVSPKTISIVYFQVKPERLNKIKIQLEKRKVKFHYRKINGKSFLILRDKALKLRELVGKEVISELGFNTFIYRKNTKIILGSFAGQFEPSGLKRSIKNIKEIRNNLYLNNLLISNPSNYENMPIINQMTEN